MTPTSEQINQVTRLIAETQGWSEKCDQCLCDEFGHLSDCQNNITGSIDAIRELVLREANNPEFRVKYLNALRQMLNEALKRPVSDFDLIIAEPYYHSVAYLKAKGKM